MTFLKIARYLVGLGAVMMLIASSQGEWAQSAGLDVWNLPKLHAEIAENNRLSEELEQDARALGQRIAVKDQLVKQLIDGRTNLATVTEQFHELNDSTATEHLRICFKATDERELSARNVMAFAQSTLDSEADAMKKPTVMNRLDREFISLFPERETH